MARSEQAIFTNMCMVYDDAGNILVQERLDPNWPGLCFPGGHVEPGEAFADAVIREVYEETGLTIEQPVLCGIKQFQTIRGNERYVVLLYRTDRFSGELRSSEEGRVFWISRSTLNRYTLVDDFEKMLAVFENEQISELYYHREDGVTKRKLL